jgi:4-carboxymuconolactone decarboxylase
MFNKNTITHIPVGNILYKLKNHNEMCGEVEAEDNDALPDSPSTRTGYVRFKDGARTKWHRHQGLQVLLVTKGVGFVEQKNAPSFEIRPGDRVYIPKEVWHRHGAKKGQTMEHLAFTDGGTEWDRKDPCE